MNSSRLAAIAGIYIVTAVAWAVLSQATLFRSNTTYDLLGQGRLNEQSAEGRASVRELWGSPQVQLAPSVWTTHIEKRVAPGANGKPTTQQVRMQLTGRVKWEETLGGAPSATQT